MYFWARPDAKNFSIFFLKKIKIQKIKEGAGPSRPKKKMKRNEMQLRARQFIEVAFKKFLEQELDLVIDQAIDTQRQQSDDRLLRNLADEFIRNIARIPLKSFRPEISINAFERRIREFTTRSPEFAKLERIEEERARVVNAANRRERERVESLPNRKRSRSPDVLDDNDEIFIQPK